MFLSPPSYRQRATGVGDAIARLPIEVEEAGREERLERIYGKHPRRAGEQPPNDSAQRLPDICHGEAET